MRLCLFFAVFVFSLACLPAWGQEQLSVVCWNVESGGSDPAVIAQRIKVLQARFHCDAWGFSEVHDQAWADQFAQAAGAAAGTRFQTILGTTGVYGRRNQQDDRLLIVYNPARLQLIEHFELHRINSGNRNRAPLVARFKHKSAGRELLFMVNHLARTDNALRHAQARELNRWAADQELPIVAVGDYNFDWRVAGFGEDRDAGFDLFQAGGVFTWVRPNTYVYTQESEYRSILDYVFIAGRDTWTWRSESEIVVEEGDFPDDTTTPDHRPVQATITLRP
jgi:endonuclease/exonuclease/phosphatase family metal-dependent hydrolase